MKFVSVAACCLVALMLWPVLAFGFRPLNPDDVARRSVEAAEAQFRVSNHAELYHYTRVDNAGDAHSGRMFIIYTYSEGEVRGVFRLLPRDDFAGATLLYRQALQAGSRPQLFLHDPAKGHSGELPTHQWWSRLGDTDWRCWLILDEDKNPWDYMAVDHITYRGHSVNVIRARYSDRELSSRTGVHFRRLYLDRQRSLAHAIEYLDRAGRPLTVLELLEHRQYELGGETQFRTRRLLLHNFQDNTLTTMVRQGSRFNTELPVELFFPGEIGNWDERWDREVLTILGE